MSTTNLPTLPGTAPKEPLETETVEASKNQMLPKNEKKADTFSISDIDAIADGDADETLHDGESVTAGPARLSQDDFYSVFKMMFAMPNMLPLSPFPIKALPVHDGEQDAARAASDAIYDIACETPFLSWLIEPGSEWMQRAMVIGAFSFGKLMAIKLELDARIVKPAPEGSTVSDMPAPEEKNEPAPEGDASTVVNIK